MITFYFYSVKISTGLVVLCIKSKVCLDATFPPILGAHFHHLPFSPPKISLWIHLWSRISMNAIVDNDVMRSPYRRDMISLAFTCLCIYMIHVFICIFYIFMYLCIYMMPISIAFLETSVHWQQNCLSFCKVNYSQHFWQDKLVSKFVSLCYGKLV